MFTAPKGTFRAACVGVVLLLALGCEAPPPPRFNSAPRPRDDLLRKEDLRDLDQVTAIGIELSRAERDESLERSITEELDGLAWVHSASTVAELMATVGRDCVPAGLLTYDLRLLGLEIGGRRVLGRLTSPLDEGGCCLLTSGDGYVPVAPDGCRILRSTFELRR